MTDLFRIYKSFEIIVQVCLSFHYKDIHGDLPTVQQRLMRVDYPQGGQARLELLFANTATLGWVETLKYLLNMPETQNNFMKPQNINMNLSSAIRTAVKHIVNEETTPPKCHKSTFAGE